MTVACLVLLLAGLAHRQAPETPFRVTTRNPEDRVSVELREDRCDFTVHSPRGIGRATIRRHGEKWPGSVVVRLRLKGLERFRVGAGTTTLSASVASGGDHRTSLSLSQGGDEEVAIDRISPFWTEVRILDDRGQPAGEIPLKNGAFEVPLPRALFVANPPTITLDWIDFYR